MADRSWFLAYNGQQHGPYPEAQFRDLIARRTVTAETMVWTEGMAGWQKAGDIPGLMSAAAGRPVMPAAPLTDADDDGRALSIDFGILDYTWRTILFALGMAVVIPGPWVLVWYLKWFTSCVHVPGRPNLAFAGEPKTIAPWYYGWVVVLIIISLLAGATGSRALSHVSSIAHIVLSWLLLKWLVLNLVSNGRLVGLSFSGSFWGFLGWSLLAGLSFLTIIGWAWVYAAQVRWICRNIQGSRREIVFNGTGLDYLWRVLVAAVASVLIIPIPWVYRWLLQWQLSQTELVPRKI
jgi:hypothetical protein